MKNKLFLFLILSLCLMACSPKLATVTTVPRKNDIIISPEMKDFSLQNRNPSVVLRVPYVAQTVSEGEQKILSQQINIYNQIEKNLLKAGFTVRDRGLLNNLLSTGQTNYTEIGKKIETDVIIEILNVDFDIDNFSHTASLKKNNKEVYVRGDILNPKIAKIECKLIIVEKGLMGAMLTLYRTSCTQGCDFYFKPSYDMVMHIGKSKYQTKVAWSLDHDQTSFDNTIAYFSNIISNILRGDFDL